MSNNCFIAAMQYAMLGWKVIPLHSIENGRCTCRNAGCTAPGKHPITQHGLKDATTDPAIINTWWTKYPWANVGVLTGQESGIVVLDIDPRHNGDDTLFDLVTKNGKLPDTLESLTGGGGKHLIFQYPGKHIPNDSKGAIFGPGIDVRGDGGYIVAVPSMHISGKNYEWEVSSDPNTTPPLSLPAWALQMFPNGNGNHTQPQQPIPGKKIGQGRRNQKLTSLAGSMRKRGFSQTAIEKALLDYNKQNCYPPLTDQEVLAIAQSIAKYAPARAPTDDELADEWLKLYPDTAYGLGEFRRFTDGYWPVVALKQVECEILPILTGAKTSGVKPSSWKMKSIIELARIKCQVNDINWDANPDVLVCKNGTLEISSKNLRNHEKTDYCTSGVAFNYDPTATAPMWTKYLNSTIPKIQYFLQEYAGYCLTIETQYELAIWLYGPAGCGKSTFIEGLLSMLGTRSSQIGLADIERSRFGLNTVAGKTLLFATEQPVTFIQASNILNALISGEMVTVERKFRDPVEIRSRAKIIWAMNELPRTAEAGSGLFRRVKIIEFDPLPEMKRDPAVKEAIKLEGSGILNWALEGLETLKFVGKFTIPQCVKDATLQWQKYNDIPANFLDDKTEEDPNSFISASLLYSEYRDWCTENGHKAQSSTSLAQDWKRLGLTKNHKMIGTVYEGRKLKTKPIP